MQIIGSAESLPVMRIVSQSLTVNSINIILILEK